MDKEKLTPEEIETLTKLLQKVTPLPKMEWPVLKTIWESRLMPMNPQELVILERIPEDVFAEDYPRVLLTKRPATDPHFPNAWHHPGGYLGSNEFVVQDAIERILQKEVKVGLKNYRAVSIINWPKLERDHEFSGLYICEPAGPPILTSGKTEWFPFTQLPPTLLYHHQLMHAKAKEYLDFMSLIKKIENVLNAHPPGTNRPSEFDCVMYYLKRNRLSLSGMFHQLSTVLETGDPK